MLIKAFGGLLLLIAFVNTLKNIEIVVKRGVKNDRLEPSDCSRFCPLYSTSKCDGTVPQCCGSCICHNGRTLIHKNNEIQCVNGLSEITNCNYVLENGFQSNHVYGVNILNTKVMMLGVVVLLKKSHLTECHVAGQIDKSSYWDIYRWSPLFRAGRKKHDFFFKQLTSDPNTMGFFINWASINRSLYQGMLIKLAVKCKDNVQSCLLFKMYGVKKHVLPVETKVEKSSLHGPVCILNQSFLVYTSYTSIGFAVICLALLCWSHRRDSSARDSHLKSQTNKHKWRKNSMLCICCGKFQAANEDEDDYLQPIEPQGLQLKVKNEKDTNENDEYTDVMAELANSGVYRNYRSYSRPNCYSNTQIKKKPIQEDFKSQKVSGGDTYDHLDFNCQIDVDVDKKKDSSEDDDFKSQEVSGGDTYDHLAFNCQIDVDVDNKKDSSEDDEYTDVMVELANSEVYQNHRSSSRSHNTDEDKSIRDIYDHLDCNNTDEDKSRRDIYDHLDCNNTDEDKSRGDIYDHLDCNDLKRNDSRGGNYDHLNCNDMDQNESDGDDYNHLDMKNFEVPEKKNTGSEKVETDQSEQMIMNPTYDHLNFTG